MHQRVNWPLVLLLSILGVGGVLGALALDDWSREAWSSVLIEAGAALALLSALVLLEQRVVLLLVVTLVLAAIGIWVAVTPSSNAWLRRDPMLGEFLLGVAPFLTGIAAALVWWKLRHVR